VTYGFARADFGGIELHPHSHMKGQIVLVQRGALSCEVEGGLWIVPPRSAVWIPGGALHADKATSALECYNAFVDPTVGARLPEVCCVVSVTPTWRNGMPAGFEISGIGGYPKCIRSIPAGSPDSAIEALQLFLVTCSEPQSM
jgi:hypothetical protein